MPHDLFSSELLVYWQLLFKRGAGLLEEQRVHPKGDDFYRVYASRVNTKKKKTAKLIAFFIGVVTSSCRKLSRD